MKRTILSWHDFEDQAAAILAASKAKRGDGLRMEDVDGDEDEGAPGDDDADEDEDDEDDDEDADDDQDEEPDDDKKGKSKKDKKDKSDDDEPVTRAEYERVKRHRAAADRRVAERDATIADLQAQLRDKDTKADGATKTRVTELESENANLNKQVKDMRIQNAFLSANKYEWVDPADALRLADLSGVEIDPDDGTVTGVKEALAALAKAKPHLIKQAKKDPQGSSGSPNNGRRKGDTKKKSREELAATYPVLRTR